MTITEMQNKLAQYYIPLIKTDLLNALEYNQAGFDFEVCVNFIERMPNVSGIRFEVVVEFTGEVISSEFSRMVTALDAYCTNEVRGIELDGYKFLLGDGDDSSAVLFRGGAFHIWLRGWKD